VLLCEVTLDIKNKDHENLFLMLLAIATLTTSAQETKPLKWRLFLPQDTILTNVPILSAILYKRIPEMKRICTSSLHLRAKVPANINLSLKNLKNPGRWNLPEFDPENNCMGFISKSNILPKYTKELIYYIKLFIK